MPEFACLCIWDEADGVTPDIPGSYGDGRIVYWSDRNNLGCNET